MSRRHHAPRCRILRIGSVYWSKPTTSSTISLSASPLSGSKLARKVVALRHILFGLLVEAAMNRVVRALEQAVFAVAHQLDGRVVTFRRGVGQHCARDDHRGADVVFHLHLFGGDEILAHLEHAPCAFFREADAQIGADQLALAELQLMAGVAVDEIDRQ